MSELVVGDPELTDWAWLKIGYIPPGTISIGWRDDEGAPVGAFLVEDYTGRGGSCRVHFAGRSGWLTRQKLRHIGRYMFEHLECARVFGCVMSSHTDTIALDLRLGFVRLTELPGFAPDGDSLVILELTKGRAARWLK